MLLRRKMFMKGKEMEENTAYFKGIEKDLLSLK